VEIDPEQAARARKAVADAGLTHRIQIIEGDAAIWRFKADVGVAYLYPDDLARVKHQLLKLDRFATYMHPVDGLPMQQSGDAWIWQKPKPAPVQQVAQATQTPRYAYYGGQAYSGRLCNSPNCAMCNAIARQLGYR
jgi:hypothetical protein